MSDRTRLPSGEPPTNEGPVTSLLGRLPLRKLIVNLIGFLIGVALFVWIVRQALAEGDWSRLLHASPWLVVILLASTLVSLLANGAMFWVTIQPIKRLGMLELQQVNAAAAMLNYAPLRLGAMLRVAYHLKVDRLKLLQITAWFALIAYLVALTVGSSLVATLVRDRLDVVWVLLVAGQMILGGAAIRLLVGNPLLARYTMGVDRMVTDPRSLWGSVTLRCIDLMAYGGRMAAAAAILGMDLPGTHVVVLAVVALAAGLIPFGRVGFREACVALAAQRLGMLTDQVESAWAQLALVDSMGEALVFLPLGLAALPGVRARWRNRDRG